MMPGARVGRLLSLQGARVIKVESPKRPDPVRTLSPAGWQALNGMKELLLIDLLDPSDRTRFEVEVRKADGLIEGFRPETKTKLGLESSRLHAINPKLCVVSIVGFSPDSPLAGHAGHDIGFSARSGLLSLTHEMAGIPFGEVLSAHQGALAMASMLDGVSRGQTGLSKTISIVDVLIEAQAVTFAEYRAGAPVPQPGQTLYNGKFPCHRVYRSRDGRRIAVGAIEDKYWDRMCEILELTGLRGMQMSDGDEGARVINAVQTAFSKRDWKDWSPVFEKADCCVDPVLSYDELPG